MLYLTKQLQQTTNISAILPPANIRSHMSAENDCRQLIGHMMIFGQLQAASDTANHILAAPCSSTTMRTLHIKFSQFVNGHRPANHISVPANPVCGVQPDNWALVGRIMTPVTRVTKIEHHCYSSTRSNNPTCAENVVFWQRNAMTTLHRAGNAPRTNNLITATDVQNCTTTPTPCVPMLKPAPSQIPPLRNGKDHIRKERK
jgi:hypothetical protein